MADLNPVTKKDLDDALAEIRLLVKEVQNVLLEHLLTQNRLTTVRVGGIDATGAALRDRVNNLEERILNLEMRPTPRPH